MNPSTSNGLKMYQTATKARETRLNPRIKNKKEFMDAMKSDAVSFGRGSVVSNLRFEDKIYDILVDVESLDVEKVRSFTSQYLYERNSSDVPPGDHNMRMYDINPAEDNEDKARLYKRVKMNMIGERI